MCDRNSGGAERVLREERVRPMTVLLLHVAHQRWEIYTEPPEEELAEPAPDAGRFRRWVHAAATHWRALVDRARCREGTTWFMRQRDEIVVRLAETIANERMLWALGKSSSATLLFPSSLSAAEAAATRDRVLAACRRHHGWWLAIDGVLFVASGLLAIVPGPNAIAYYLAFRLIGHWQSWTGAQRARDVQWTLTPDEGLAELAALAAMSRDVRRARVDAIARRLHLHRLTAFFERVTA
jgi:hypothetical protein